VVLAVAVLTLVFGWLWSINADPPTARQIFLRDEPAKWWAKPMHPRAHPRARH
jgi:hypothetical protein